MSGGDGPVRRGVRGLKKRGVVRSFAWLMVRYLTHGRSVIRKNVGKRIVFDLIFSVFRSIFCENDVMFFLYSHQTTSNTHISNSQEPTN